MANPKPIVTVSGQQHLLQDAATSVVTARESSYKRPRVSLMHLA